MKTLDNIKLTELSMEEKMNVNGGGLWLGVVGGLIAYVVIETVNGIIDGATEPCDENNSQNT